MKKEPIKLDDISRKVPLDTPQHYFEELPMRIRERIDAERKPAWRLRLAPALKLALVPVTMVVLALFFWPSQAPPETDYAQMLADIPEEALVAYLDDTEGLHLSNSFEVDQPELEGTLDEEFDDMFDVLDVQDDELDDLEEYLESWEDFEG